MVEIAFRAPHRARAGLTVSMLAKEAATAVSVINGWRRGTVTRRAIAALTPDQLRDVGYPEAPRAILAIKAGLMANLMSMR